MCSFHDLRARGKHHKKGLRCYVTYKEKQRTPNVSVCFDQAKPHKPRTETKPILNTVETEKNHVIKSGPVPSLN